MKLTPKNQIKSDFNIFSMTDIVFLLLLFFMLTSQFITFSGLEIQIPHSKVSKSITQKVTVSITKDREYFVNEKQVTMNGLKQNLQEALLQSKGNNVLILVDKRAAVQPLIDVVAVANQLDASVMVLTKEGN